MKLRSRLQRRLLTLVVLPSMVFGQGVSDVPRGERAWSVPSDLTEHGSRTENSIRIAIFGYAVERPGYYYLPKGAAVQDAAVAAKTRGFIGWDPHYSGIQRHKPDGSVEAIRFKAIPRTIAEKISLRDGDVLQLSHEVY